MFNELSTRLISTGYISRSYSTSTTFSLKYRLFMYLSYPFVLGWSLLEAVRYCSIVGSNCMPVSEVIDTAWRVFLHLFQILIRFPFTSILYWPHLSTLHFRQASPTTCTPI